MIDRAEFDQIYMRWYTQLVYFAYYFVDDGEICKDIVSDIFEYLWRNRTKINKDTVKTYLYQAVRTRCIDHLRRQDVHKDYVEFSEQVSQRVINNEGAQETDERMTLIQKAMEKLTPYNRHILEECYINNKSYKEVAESLNVSVAAIHKNIVKALHTIRKEVSTDGSRNNG